MKRTTPEIIALMLAVTVCTILLAVVGSAVITRTPLEPDAKQIAGALLGSMITLLGFLVEKLIKKRK